MRVRAVVSDVDGRRDGKRGGEGVGDGRSGVGTDGTEALEGEGTRDGVGWRGKGMTGWEGGPWAGRGRHLGWRGRVHNQSRACRRLGGNSHVEQTRDVYVS